MTQKNLLTYLLVSIHLFLAGCQQNTVRDIEGNRYRTIEIGDQLWMAENLKTTRYNDGTPIPNVTGYEDWAALETAAYCWYNNDSTHASKYGALYNWYVVESGEVCPEGWHVPTNEDWNKLSALTEEPFQAAGHLKAAGTDHWRSPNSGASNTTGFTALPGGYRSYNGTFNLLRASGYWWSSTEGIYYGAPRVIFRTMQHDNTGFHQDICEKNNGFSIRCLKNKY
jgi:uncharacterized protein (TIGR02145 family)